MNKKVNHQNIEDYSISEKDVQQYVLERFTDVKNSKMIKNLVNFQAMNKYMMMSHDQEESKKMGNIVASYKKKQLSEVIEKYEIHLKKGLEKHPTIKSHTNVIMHIFGYFSKQFTQYEKERYFELIEKYRESQISLGNTLAEINPLVFRFNNTYLASQTYFLLYSNPQKEILFQAINKKLTQN